MGSMNISIKEEAYRFLKSVKTKDESFSDVILRFKKGNRNDGKELLKYAGELKNKDWKVKEKEIKNFRKSFDNKLKNMIKYRKE